MIVSTDYKSHDGKLLTVHVARDGTTLATHLRVAAAFASRLQGLLGKPALQRGEGLLLTKCNSIHMFFMNYSLDLVFCSAKDTVLGLTKNIKPWRVSRRFSDASYVLELPGGTIETAGLQLNDQLIFSESK